jgi:hypothetical protein
MTKVDPITSQRPELKCDADGCDYVEIPDAISPSHIGKPCPKCGADLLTEQDYRDALGIVAAAQMLNAELGPMEPSGNAITLNINPHAGNLHVRKVAP